MSSDTPQLARQIDCYHKKHGRCGYARRVAALAQSPKRVADSVDDLHRHPGPPETHGCRPSATHPPQYTPEPKSDERHVEYHESSLLVLRYHPGDEAGRGERFPKAPHILLYRVCGLHQDERAKRHVEPGHEQQSPPGGGPTGRGGTRLLTWWRKVLLGGGGEANP